MLEINPAFVEAVEHPDAGERVFHPLRFEKRFPRVMRHGLHPHGMAEEFRESRRDFVKHSDPREYVHPARADAEAHTITEFFALRRYQNWQARFIAGLPYHLLYPRLDHAAFDREVGRRATAHLRDAYVFGLQERFGPRAAPPRPAGAPAAAPAAPRPPMGKRVNILLTPTKIIADRMGG